MQIRVMVPYRCRTNLVDICPTVYDICALQGLPANAVAATLRTLYNEHHAHIAQGPFQRWLGCKAPARPLGVGVDYGS